MTAVGESDSSLAAKCLDFCQTLAGQGLAFNFSLSISSTFSFSLDTREKGRVLATQGKTKKKSSPSTLRRNARRKAAFLQRKQNPTTAFSEVDVDHPAAELPQQGEVNTFNCDICGKAFKSDNGLKIHKGKSHQTSDLPQLEKTRGPGIELSLNVSTVKDIREEVSDLQVYKCVACGQNFDSEDNLDDHLEIYDHGFGIVRCFACKQFLMMNRDDTTGCPSCSTPWQSHRI